jgi:hypothetical protein
MRIWSHTAFVPCLLLLCLRLMELRSRIPKAVLYKLVFNLSIPLCCYDMYGGSTLQSCA